MEKQFRYPGTRPFQEDDRELFFGRNTDIEKLTELIVLEKLVLLFSKSGYGKSSLLNAGVIPRLNEVEKLQTISIRLNDPNRNPVELLAFHIKTKDKKNTFLESKFNIPAELSDDASAILWYNAKSIQLAQKDSPALVLLFDQFEELFNYAPAAVEDFASEVASLLHPNLPDGVRKLFKKKMEFSKDYFTKAETEFLIEPINLKVLFSLRSDRISLLNQLKGAIPAIFKKTYELQPLNEDQALEALLEPAEKAGDFASPIFTYSEDSITRILNSLKDKEHQRIETFQLQLICQHVEEQIIQKQKANPTATKLELTAAELGNPDDIFEEHYNILISSLPEENQLQARILIEDKLIIGGNRVPLPESVITSEHLIPEHLLKTLVDKRLLRSETNTVGGTSFELSHDTLVAPIQKTAQIRREKEAEKQLEKENSEKLKIQRRRWMARMSIGMILLTLFSVAAAIFAYKQGKEAKKQALDAETAKNEAFTSDSSAQIEKFKAIDAKNQAEMSDSLAKIDRSNAIQLFKAARKSDSLAQLEKDIAYKQASTSKALFLAANVNDLLGKGRGFHALRVAEAAYRSALEASPYPPTPIFAAISAAFYGSKSIQTSYFEGHQSAVSSVAFSPDGNSVLTGSTDETAILWDTQGKQIQKFEGHRGPIHSVAFSPDGESVLTGSWDNTAILWDTQGKQIQIFTEHQEWVYSVAFSPDGKSVLTGSGDKTAILWDMEGTPIRKFEGHQDAVYSAAFSPDGKSVLTGSYDNTAIRWETKAKPIQKFEGHQKGVLSVAFSPNGNSILTGSGDKTAILWDIKGKQIQKYAGHGGPIHSVAFSPDGKSLLTGSKDNTAIIWDRQGKQIQKFIGHQNAVTSVAVSPDGMSLLTGSYDKTAIFWDKKGEEIQKFEWNRDSVYSVAFSPDGNFILTGHSGKTAILWETQGKQIQKFTGHQDWITSVAYSPDGNLILTGSKDKTAILWETQGKQIQKFVGHQDWITSVAFSPDGKSLLTGSVDNTAILWDIKGKQIQKFVGHKDAINSVAFSPDGKSILTGSSDKTAILRKTPLGIFDWLQSKECPLRQLTQEEQVLYGILEEND